MWAELWSFVETSAARDDRGDAAVPSTYLAVIVTISAESIGRTN
jgi:hypothetical protein